MQSNITTETIQPSSFKTKLLFCCGQIGWSLTIFGFAELIYMFYLPPDNGVPLFKSYIYQGSILQIFTIIGILTAVGYIISAFMEPIVAAWSDRNNFKFGKRKTIMAIGVLPFAISATLVFFPITEYVSTINAIWVIVTTLIAFSVKCLYTTPYNAMINEVGTTEKDRLHLVMLLSVTYGIGIGLGNLIHIIIKVSEGVLTHERAFQYTILAYSTLAFILMMIPILFVEDNSNKKQSNQKPVGAFEMMHTVWQNKNFRTFAFTELVYWFPSKIFTVAIPYFVTALMQLDNYYTSIILYACGIGSFATYPIIDKLVAKYGKKKILQSAFLGLAISSLFTATIGLYNLPTGLFIAIYILLNTYPTAVLGILPMSLTSDIAEEDFQKTGVSKNASYYGFKTFMMKIGVAITSLIFPSLLLLGKTPENPLGVRMISIACIITSLLAFFIFRKFKEIEKLA
ncbi:MAG: MFS transporter [Bacteroidetes bacterium]|nr:MFS transporter [Bacteroidota bacterium]